MITGHLQEKNGRYYMVLNLKNENNKWKPKWIATGLLIKGNKKKANTMLQDTIRKYEDQQIQPQCVVNDILFSNYMLNWLKLIRNSVEDTTFTSYRRNIKGSIVPYFKKLGVSLLEVEPKHISDYYDYLMDEKRNSAATVRRHHANIRKWQRAEALKKTKKVRPDLLEKAALTPEDYAVLRGLKEK